MKTIQQHLTFSNSALCFAMVFAWQTGGSPLSAALIVVAALTAKGVERFYFARGQADEAEAIKKEIQALQDRMGRAELGIGLKNKF